MDASEFQHLPEEQQARWRSDMEELSKRLQELHRKSHEWGRQRLQELNSFDRETAVSVTRRVMDCVRKNHQGIPPILEYLSQVEIDVVDCSGEFLENAQEGLAAALRNALKSGQEDGNQSLRRYRINVLVDHGDRSAAPVVQEENPTLANINGRVEHESQFGNLVTHFTLIKPGALHRAAGGYLLLDALKVLRNPFAWEALKRAIGTEEIRMESLGEAMGLVPTLTLEPEPIPLRDTKIILFGERLLYYLLAGLDSDFPELFKVLVDFDESMDRSPEA